MTVDATFFAALSLAAGIMGAVCGSVRGTAFVLQEHSGAAAMDTAAGSFRPLAILFLGLSFLFALLACAGLWLERGGLEESTDRTYPSAWGVLWVYALLLVIEWRMAGLSGVGRRILVGAFLGGMGALALGIGFEVWLKLVSLPLPACEDGTPVIEDAGIKAAAALGLSLVPIAGPALRLVLLVDLPLSTIAASVVVATWMQPALPALGWLPTLVGGGAPLALVLFAALWTLRRSYERGEPAMTLGIVAYFALAVGGCVALGTL